MKVLAALTTGLALFSASAMAWPEKTVTFVVTFPPGGSTDQVGRAISQPLTQVKLLGADQATAHTIIFDKRRTGPEAGSTWPAAVRTSVTGFLMVNGAELVTPDVTADSRFAGLKGTDSAIRALPAVPLRVDGRMTGLLAVSEQAAGREWTGSDVQLMHIVAAHSAGVIEKARLRAEAEEKRRLELENERMEKELLLARDIQMRLVPDQALVTGA